MAYKIKNKKEKEEYPIFTEKEIIIIGKKEGLSGEKLNDFTFFIQKRFPDERSSSYVQEWAHRFKNDEEWNCADKYSKEILKKINSNKY